MPKSHFAGFTSAETFTRVPDSFFGLLAGIDSLEELKVTLYMIWQVEHAETRIPALALADLQKDKILMAGLTTEGLLQGVEQAVQRGTLLRVDSSGGSLFLLNSPRGRAAAEALEKTTARGASSSAEMVSRPNIFKLYEENIGPLTGMIAEVLKDAERDYPAEWIAEAVQTAVEMNKRNWKYIEAILKRWKEEGRAEEQNRREHQKDDGGNVLDKVEAFRRRK